MQKSPVPVLARARQANLVVAAHVAVHGLPIAATAEPRRRRIPHHFQDGRESGL